jgi:peptidoglycan/LPS O-acetylase OafA/YrhL
MNKSFDRLHQLDVLRAAAILMVLAAHYPKQNAGLATRALDFGWTGVDLFFVLSGYLIAGQLFKALSAGASIRLTVFYLRRALRTLPSYFVMLAAYYTFARITTAPSPDWRFLVFIQNFGIPTTFSPSWSLCVEEQFYLLFPIALVILFRSEIRRVALVLVPLLLVLEMAIRAGVWYEVRPDLLTDQRALSAYLSAIYYPTYCRLDGIVFGAGLAAVKYFYPGSWRRLMASGPKLGVSAAAMLGVATATLWRHYCLVGATVGFTALNASFALTLAWAISSDSALGRIRIPGAKPIAILSYSIYLTHNLALMATETLVARADFGVDSVAGCAIAAIVILAFAAPLYWCVERPALQLRERLKNAPASQLAAAEGMAAAA